MRRHLFFAPGFRSRLELFSSIMSAPCKDLMLVVIPLAALGFTALGFAMACAALLVNLEAAAHG
jgi:hypothetical protein